MNYIRNGDGNVVSKSKNLRGIRRYVSHNLIKSLSICIPSCLYPFADGKLCILFENGNSFECNFASYSVLKGFVRRWRNVYGSVLYVQGVLCDDDVSYDNEWLK